MTKAEEIKRLEELGFSDTYFNQYFKADIETMVRNIQNDFPIEMECSWQIETGKQIAKNKKNMEGAALALETAKVVFKESLENLVAGEETKRRSLLETMLVESKEYGDRLYERVVEEIGKMETIRLKRLLGLEITGDEIDFLLLNK